MKRILLLTALFGCLLTVGAQSHHSSHSKARPSSSRSSSASTAKSSAPTVSKPSGSYGGHDYVDLGLPSGTLWATCNVGASKPTEYGDYFAWGETVPKRVYDWSTYFDTSDGGMTFRKYNNDGGKTELSLADDAAYVNWGSGWRMPSQAQMEELCEKCRWTWCAKNGVSGYVVQSKSNGHSLFLPAAGLYNAEVLDEPGSQGRYWSRSLNGVFSDGVYLLDFYRYNVDWCTTYRCFGQSVRPVRMSASE